MNRTTKTFLSAAALVAAATAAAPAANAAPQFQTGKFRVELEGVQKTAWESSHVKQFACDSNSKGAGKETVRFTAKPAVATISRFGNSTPIVMIGRKQATLDLRSKITRNGKIEDWGGEICSYGDGDGDVAKPADCGTKRAKLYADLTYDSRRPTFIGLEQTLFLPLGPFYNCPSGGTSWPKLLDRDVDKSRMFGQRLPARELFEHGKHIVIGRGREVVRTTESSSTTTIRWTLSLTRVVR